MSTPVPPIPPVPGGISQTAAPITASTVSAVVSTELTTLKADVAAIKVKVESALAPVITTVDADAGKFKAFFGKNWPIAAGFLVIVLFHYL